MAEARSYARQGQFSGRIQAPQTAKAKRQRDQEMVAELKEENRALKQRDAEFLAAYKEKLNNERAARADVEKARRYSVEAERQQRVDNFNLAADFAQQEQKARNEVLESFGDMIPKVSEYLQEEVARREEAETAAADAAIAQSGLTPDELREYSQVSWTADLLNSEKYKDLKAKLDAGNINYKQFIDIVNRRGIWGRAGARWELIQRVKTGPAALTQAVTDGYEFEGTKLFDGLYGDVPGNDRRVVGEWLRNWKQDLVKGYNPAFIEETIGENLTRFENSIIATRNKKAEAQAKESFIEGENVALITNLSGNGQPYKNALGIYANDPKAHFQQVKYDGQKIIELIKTKRISNDQLNNYLNTQVWNPSLNKGQGGMNAVRDDPRIMTGIEIAIAERDRQTLSQSATRIDMDNLASVEAIHAHKQALETLSPQQSMEYIDNVMADPKELNSVKYALSRYAPRTDPGADYANWKINNLIDQRVKAGIPIDPSLLNGASGEVYARGQKLIAQQNSMAAYDKVAKDSTKNWIRRVTGRQTDFETGHDDFPQVHMLLQRRYKEIQAGLIERRGTNGLTDKEIHNTAIEQLKDEWEAGTKPKDEAERTGQFRYIEGENPTTGEFTEIYNVGVPRVQPKISEAHDTHGNGFTAVSGTVFTKSRTESFQAGPGAITKSDWDRARDAAGLEGIAPVEVIVRQMEANGHTPPPALVQAADSAGKLVKMNNQYQTDLQEVSKLGEQGYGRVRLMRAARDLSTDMTPNNIVSIVRERASGQPGLDLWLEDKRAMALLPGRVKYIGEQYNPDGSGYGIYVTVESLNPITGHLMDVVYAHAAEGSVAVDVGDQLNTGTFIFQQGGTGSVSSSDGTIFSIDFFRAGPPGTGDMTPTPDYQRVVNYIINQIRGIV